jgi:O-6-methylguanine DNA methyltransferase
MSAPQTAIVGTVPTTFGDYTAGFTPQGLAILTFPGDAAEDCRTALRRWEPTLPVTTGLGPADDPRLAQLRDELNAYFAGDLRVFRTRLDQRGTPFQRLVYHALLGIPWGETRSYGQMAVAIGRPASVRAVGAANGANPIPILVPCHRVIGANGTLTGYGGGLDLKARLLAIEGIDSPRR